MMLLDAHSGTWHVSIGFYSNAQWTPGGWYHIGRNEKCDDCSAKLHIYSGCFELLKFRFHAFYEDRTHEDRKKADKMP